MNGSDPEDAFESAFANEAADKNQRRQEAEKRANNQSSQTQENDQEEELTGAYEVKEYLSHGDGKVYVEWSEQTNGQWGRNCFQWIDEERVQEGLSVFNKKYTPLKEEVPIDSIK